MGSIDIEEQRFHEEVNTVKQWWTNPRWRYTKRPFTAEQIVAKRGNLKIECPSNVQSKKLWNLIEERFKVWPSVQVGIVRMLILKTRTVMQVILMVSWSQLCSRKWQNIWTLFMSLAGSVHQRLRQRMSLRQILQTTQWYETIYNALPLSVNKVRILFPTKSNSFF